MHNSAKTEFNFLIRNFSLHRPVWCTKIKHLWDQSNSPVNTLSSDSHSPAVQMFLFVSFVQCFPPLFVFYKQNPMNELIFISESLLCTVPFFLDRQFFGPFSSAVAAWTSGKYLHLGKWTTMCWGSDVQHQGKSSPFFNQATWNYDLGWRDPFWPCCATSLKHRQNQCHWKSI